jgi:hypothetical protein
MILLFLSISPDHTIDIKKIHNTGYITYRHDDVS